MAIKERKQLSGSTTAISKYAGHEGQVVWDKTKKEFVGMSGTVGKTYPVAMKDFVVNELGKKANTEQLTPLAKDADVLKLIAQSLTPEQKAQVAKNLDNFLTKGGATGIDGSYRMSPTSTGIAIGAEWDTKAGAILDLQSNVDWRKGSWLLHARNPQEQSTLEGKADGTLTWGGDSIDSIVYSDLDTHNYTKGFSIRYRSGLQFSVCYAEVNVNSNSYASVEANLTVPFLETKSHWGIGAVTRCSGGWKGVTVKVDTYETKLGFNFNNPNSTQIIGAVGFAVGFWK